MDVFSVRDTSEWLYYITTYLYYIFIKNKESYFKGTKENFYVFIVKRKYLEYQIISFLLLFVLIIRFSMVQSITILLNIFLLGPLPLSVQPLMIVKFIPPVSFGNTFRFLTRIRIFYTLRSVSSIDLFLIRSVHVTGTTSPEWLYKFLVGLRVMYFLFSLITNSLFPPFTSPTSLRHNPHRLSSLSPNYILLWLLDSSYTDTTSRNSSKNPEDGIKLTLPFGDHKFSSSYYVSMNSKLLQWVLQHNLSDYPVPVLTLWSILR